MKRIVELVTRADGKREVLVEDCVETRQIDGEWFVVGTKLDGDEVKWGPFAGEAEAEETLLLVHAAQIDIYRRAASDYVDAVDEAERELRDRGGRLDG